MIFYYMIIIFFKYDGFILNMVIISNMDTQHNIYHLNLSMSCQQMEKSAIY